MTTSMPSKALSNRGKSDARASRLDHELQDVATLMDELGSNLDEYSDRHADIRVALKTLSDESQHWLTTLKALAGEEPFDLSRKEAIEAGRRSHRPGPAPSARTD